MENSDNIGNGNTTVPLSDEEREKKNEQTYNNLQAELDDIDAELEKNPNNQKLIDYARQTTKIMEDILDRLEGQTGAMTYDEAQDAGARAMASAKQNNQEVWYENSRGERYATPEDARDSEPAHWQTGNDNN